MTTERGNVDPPSRARDSGSAPDSGSTLLPMLISGITLITVGMIIAAILA